MANGATQEKIRDLKMPNASRRRAFGQYLNRYIYQIADQLPASDAELC